MIKKTLYFGNPIYLSLRNAQLVLRTPDADKLEESFKQDAERTIPIEDIGVVVLDNKRITITTGAMEALLNNNCAIITCNSTNLPVGLMLPLNGNTTQSERFRSQIDASLPLKKQLWQQTIRQKIQNQATVLNKNTGAIQIISKHVQLLTTGATSFLQSPISFVDVKANLLTIFSTMAMLS